MARFIRNLREQAPGGKIRYQIMAWVAAFAVGYVISQII